MAVHTTASSDSLSLLNRAAEQCFSLLVPGAQLLITQVSHVD
uniref:Uncharacterized protein n=1 Tax=Anguilla anguilla TaxID=7936 RepID=A0A0E9VB91_ANGAN